MYPGIQKLKASTDEFSPRILNSSIFLQGMNYPQGFKLKGRYVYDYELEFFTESRGSMIIEDKLYPIHKGDLVFRRPGQFTQGIMPYCCYLINFDLLGNTHKSSNSYDFNTEQTYQSYYSNPLLDAIPPVFHPLSQEKYIQLFDKVFMEFIHPSETSAALLKASILQILCQAYSDIQIHSLESSIHRSPYYTVVKKVLEYMKENIQSRISLKSMSDVSGLSPNHFHKIFKRSVGMTPNEYLIKTRVDKSKNLLVETSLPITEIALQCGFQNTPYFSHLFRRKEGMSPGEFRKRHSYI